MKNLKCCVVISIDRYYCSEKEFVVDEGVSGEIAPSAEVSHEEEPLVEDVGDYDAQQEPNVQLLVVHCHLNDETHDAAVQHHEVPVHAHQEEVPERVPLVLEQHRLVSFQLIYRRPVEQVIEDASLLDVLFGLGSDLFDAPHEKFVHDLSRGLRLVDVEAFRDGVLT